MREFVELLILADHSCSDPRVERIEVYEPIAMQSSWISILRCCSQVFSEPSERVAAPTVWRPVPAAEAAA